VDGGMLYLSHRRSQRAADLAALAGAQALATTSSTAAATIARVWRRFIR